MRGSIAPAVCLCVLFSTLQLRTAQAGDAAGAERLFKEALALDDAGKWRQACVKFRASLQIDASVGAQLNVAKCFDKEGKLAKAESEYQHARVLNGRTPDPQRRDAVAQFIAERLAELQPRVPLLTINVKDPQADVPPADLVVTRNGTVLPPGALGTALSMDPGVVSIEARAGNKEASESVKLVEGDRRTVTLELALVPTAPSIPPAAVVPPPPPADTPAAQPPLWPWIVGGLGLAMGGVAVGFSIDYAVTRSSGEDSCGDLADCKAPAADFDVDAFNARLDRDTGLGIGFGAAAAVAVTIAIVGLVSDNAGAAPPLVVSPQLTPSAVGASVLARY